MHQFLLDLHKPIKARAKDINLSARYDDRLMMGGTNYKNLDSLSILLHEQITYCSHDIFKMERLAEQFYQDSLAALQDNNIGYYMRYFQAYERLNHLIVWFYASLPCAVIVESEDE